MAILIIKKDLGLFYYLNSNHWQAFLQCSSQKSLYTPEVFYHHPPLPIHCYRCLFRCSCLGYSVATSTWYFLSEFKYLPLLFCSVTWTKIPETNQETSNHVWKTFCYDPKEEDACLQLTSQDAPHSFLNASSLVLQACYALTNHWCLLPWSAAWHPGISHSPHSALTANPF